MSKTTFIAIDPQGVVHKRTSQGRTYTHTVVFLRGDAYAARKLAESLAYTVKQAPENFKFYTSLRDGSWHADSAKRFPGLYEDAAYVARHVAEDKARADREIGDLDLAGYTAKCQEQVRADYRERAKQGYFNTFCNDGWCSRLDLARKLADKARKHGFEQIVILEATRKPKAGDPGPQMLAELLPKVG